MRRYRAVVVGVVVAGLAVAGSAATTRLHPLPGRSIEYDGTGEWSEPAAYYPQTYSFTYAPIKVKGKRPLRIRAVRLRGASPGLVVDGLHAIDLCGGAERTQISGAVGPITGPFPHVRLHPVRGLVVAPGRDCWYVVVEVHADAPGTYRAPRIEYEYTVGRGLLVRRQSFAQGFVLVAKHAGAEPCGRRPCPGGSPAPAASP